MEALTGGKESGVEEAASEQGEGGELPFVTNTLDFKLKKPGNTQMPMGTDI